MADDPRGFHVDTAHMKASISFYDYNEIENMWRAGDQLACVKSYKRELELYSRAYESKNWEEAARHRIKLADNLTRQWLLRLRIQPKSRTELPGQLRVLSTSLFSVFNNLARETTSNKSGAERKDKELWRYRQLTSQLSDETPGFLDLIGLLYGNGQEAKNAVWAFLSSRGFQVTDSPGAKEDMLVKDPDGRKSFTIKVKSLKAGLDKKNVGTHLLNRSGEGKNLCLVYNPYRDIPVDERVFSVNPEVAKRAEEMGIKLIPSNVFFSEGCDLIINEASKSEWIEALLGRAPEITGTKRSSRSR